jgi:hypothetical protein
MKHLKLLIKNSFLEEIKDLLRLETVRKIYNYKILAKNKAVMILEAINND